MKKRLLFLLFLTFLVIAPTWANTVSQTHWLRDQTNGIIILSRNSNEVRAIASITKLMTAMVTLDHNMDLNKKLKVSNKLGTFLPGREHSRLDILTAMLVRSDNAASETLANDYPGGRSAFINAMNEKAKSLGMLNTNFSDPSGLTDNTSTAEDLNIMIVESSKYPVIRQLSTTRQAEFSTTHQKRTVSRKVENTNSTVLFEFNDVVVSKTGLTRRAGWCVGMMIETVDKTYVMIVLGAKTKLERLKIVEEIMHNHITFKNANY